MPTKFHLHAEHAPPRIRPIGKLGIVEWREDCARCNNCVKDACVYGFYRDEANVLREETGYLDYIYQCKGCLNCVQNCTKGILTRVVNPEFRRLGDAYYRPETIFSIWYQAETGRIPVSGAGYGGPFTGAGFDSMWTDMSEIVRPTRDGIHGREYISTSVDIGRKVDRVTFQNGQPTTPPPLIEIPLPVIFEVLPPRWSRAVFAEAVARAASKIGLLAIARADAIPNGSGIEPSAIIPWPQKAGLPDPTVFRDAQVVMVSDQPALMELWAALKKNDPERIVAVRVQAAPDVAARVLHLTRKGVEVVHLIFDSHGRESAPSHPRHMRDVLREVHRLLVRECVRDQVTLIASGGVAEAEHMAKAIICGADLVAIDVPLMVALECRLCGECERGEPCPIALDEIGMDFAVRRMVNLMAAWHQQVIEVLGAMGIREIRRLRGETGRAMFFEDLEREVFGRLFGKRKEIGTAP